MPLENSSLVSGKFRKLANKSKLKTYLHLPVTISASDSCHWKEKNLGEYSLVFAPEILETPSDFVVGHWKRRNTVLRDFSFSCERR